VWIHPVTKRKVYFILFVDSGCRFKVGKVLFEDSRKTATWNDLKTAFEELWLPIFGKPRGVRVDPAGAWLNTQAESYFSQHDILFDHIPAEAHWQISAVEQGIKTVKGIMESLATDFVDMEIRELFARSIWVCNNQEIYKGYSPLQHALGRAPDEHQRMFECDDVKPVLPSVLADGGFQEDATMRCKAEKAFAEEQAKRRLERAARMGHRRAQVYVPGDLVYYWRKQLQPGDRTSFQTGKFLGPARVIATETRKDEDGILRPGSVVWVHRGGRLLRCAPEQLRKASPHEQQIEELHGPVELPWTITTLATDPSRRTMWILVEKYLLKKNGIGLLIKILKDKNPNEIFLLYVSVEKRQHNPNHTEGNFVNRLLFKKRNEVNKIWKQEVPAVAVGPTKNPVLMVMTPPCL
jgi:hypothetical protein